MPWYIEHLLGVLIGLWLAGWLLMLIFTCAIDESKAMTLKQSRSLVLRSRWLVFWTTVLLVAWPVYFRKACK